uniref:UBR-type domain-containing protein n=1 Tax=Globodera rostochiensis TaxID=31243 RepID=A0A914ICI6_GLORO
MDKDDESECTNNKISEDCANQQKNPAPQNSTADGSTPAVDENNPNANVSAEEQEEEIGTTVEDFVGTLDELIKMHEENEDTAVALLGGSLDLVCTYSEGYKGRQPLYSCKTCFLKTGKLAGVCYACSENCHHGHDLVEMYSKRHFCCDCGNTKFETKCKLFEEKDPLNKRNKYNDNFKGIFCTCKKPFPPEANDVDASLEDMLQCCMCEDWFHPSHIFPPGQCPIEDDMDGLSDDIDGIICKDCVVKHTFLAFYPFGKRSWNEFSKNGDKNGEEEEEGSSSKCKLEALKKFKQQLKDEEIANSLWVQVGWREQLCRCKECMNLYEDLDCQFLLEPEDTIAYFEQQNREKAAQKDDVLASIEHMKQHCKEFFEKRVSQKRGPITGDDVEQKSSRMDSTRPVMGLGLSDKHWMKDKNGC